MKQKICFRGDSTDETGEKIITALKNLGGINASTWNGNSNQYYFINSDGFISMLLDCPEGFHVMDINTYHLEKPTEFTVEGSSALLEAFLKEYGGPYSKDGDSSIIDCLKHKECPYVFFSKMYKGSVWHDQESFTHFILPREYDKALEMAKDFFKPKQFVPELNTWVWISCKNISGNNNVDALIFNNGEEYPFGFNHGGEWTDVFGLGECKSDEFLRQATDKEVENALIEEAKKRGFKKGVKVMRSKELLLAHDTPCVTNPVVLTNDDFVYNSRGHYLSIDGRVIYCNGLWPDIIPNNTITVAGIEFVYRDGILYCKHGEIAANVLKMLIDINVGGNQIK